MQLAAYSLMVLRDVTPILLSTAGSVFLLLVGMLMFYIGLERFVAKESRQTHNFILLAAFVPLYVYFVLFVPSLNVRSILFSLALFALSAQCAWLMLRRVEADMLPVTRRVGILMIAYCILSLVYVLLNLALPPATDLFQANRLRIALIVAYQMLSVILVFYLFMMVNQRMFLDTDHYIAARKRADKALHQVNERLSLAQRLSQSGVWDWDIHTNELNWSPELFHLSGLPTPIGGKTSFDAWQAVTHPDDRQKVQERIDAALRGNIPLIHDYRIVLPSGENRWVNASGSITYNEKGEAERMTGICIDIDARKQAEEQLRNALAEKEMLLRELNHRTKNNLGLVSSLINLQANISSDETFQALALALENRIRSIALVHQMLYRSQNLARVDLAEYTRELVGHLMSGFAASTDKIVVDINATPAFVGINTAIPCGQILNELISNAFKYAFPGERRGRVAIQIGQAQDGEVLLKVTDDGVGLPPGFDESASASLGMTLLHMLVQQIDGQIEIKSGKGVTCEIRFKAETPA